MPPTPHAVQVAEQAATLLATHLDRRQWGRLARLLQLLNLSIEYWPSNASYLAAAGAAPLTAGMLPGAPHHCDDSQMVMRYCQVYPYPTSTCVGILHRCPVLLDACAAGPWLQAAALDMLLRLLRADERTIAHVISADTLRCGAALPIHHHS